MRTINGKMGIRSTGQGAALWLLLTTELLACDSQPASSSVADAAASAPSSLVNHQAWTEVSAEADPLADHRPQVYACDIAGWLPEADTLEIDTGRCNYVMLTQPALTQVQPGDRVQLELYHFDLTAPEPAQAHLAILFGERVQWETTLEIPRDGQVMTVDWQARDNLNQGEPIRFHLHNHGQNTWNLVHLLRMP